MGKQCLPGAERNRAQRAQRPARVPERCGISNRRRMLAPSAAALRPLLSAALGRGAPRGRVRVWGAQGPGPSPAPHAPAFPWLRWHSAGGAGCGELAGHVSAVHTAPDMLGDELGRFRHSALIAPSRARGTRAGQLCLGATRPNCFHLSRPCRRPGARRQNGRRPHWERRGGGIDGGPALRVPPAINPVPRAWGDGRCRSDSGCVALAVSLPFPWACLPRPLPALPSPALSGPPADLTFPSFTQPTPPLPHLIFMLSDCFQGCSQPPRPIAGPRLWVIAY